MQEAQHNPRLSFYGGTVGELTPLLAFVVGATYLGFAGAPDERGLWTVLLLALGIALLLCRNRDDCAEVMIAGMSQPLVLLMIFAWLFAGVFGALLSASGLVQALAGAANAVGLQGGLFCSAAFLVACLFSTATGTSLGTIILCFPLLYPAGAGSGAAPFWLAGAIVAGSTFGDNISPVSDTTIASATTQAVALGDVVASRLRYALPAAALSLLGFGILGGGEPVTTDLAATADFRALLMLAAPAFVLYLLLRRSHLVVALAAGIGAALLLGVAGGFIAWREVVYIDPAAYGARGLLVDGLERGVGVSIFTLLLMGIVAVVEQSRVVARFSSGESANTVAAGERQIFGAITAACLLTTHSSVAILAVGGTTRRIGERLGIPATRRANILDTTVCTYPFLLPWFIPTILAANLTVTDGVMPRLTALQIGLANLHSLLLLAILCAAVFLGYGRVGGSRSEESPERRPVET
jgi:Na+/H+ antiporter NhaC